MKLTFQRLKQSFLCNLWNWVSKSINPNANPVVDFIDESLMECFCAVPFLFVLVHTICILPIYFGGLYGVFLLIQLFTSKKKKLYIVTSIDVGDIVFTVSKL